MNALYEIIKAYYAGGAYEPVRRRVNLVLPLLNERQRRLYLAYEAQTIGPGGIAKLSKMTGISPSIITRGLKELAAGAPEAAGARKVPERKNGVRLRYPDILDGLKAIIENQEERAENILHYTTKSAAGISAALKEKGLKVSSSVIAMLLKEDGYTLRKTVKKGGVDKGPAARAQQFVYINKKARAYIKRGEAVLAIEVKELGRGKDPSQAMVYDHDYLMGELGKDLPSAPYELFHRGGFVNAGLEGDTAGIAVERLGHWWEAGYFERCRNTGRMLITAGFRENLEWTGKLRELAGQVQKKITVLHFPPGITKWDRIEHRFYTFIGGEGGHVRSVVIINLIGAEAGTGLTVEYVPDSGVPGGAGEGEARGPETMKGLVFHGEWDYTVLPKKRRGKGRGEPGPGGEEGIKLTAQEREQ
jgi:hypothetical protein